MERVQGSPQPLGVAIENKRVNFAVSVPKGKTCELLLYKAGAEKEALVFPMTCDEAVGEVRFLALAGIEPTQYEYNYRINQEICLDPYVKQIVGHTEFGKKERMSAQQVRGKLICSSFEWGEDHNPQIPYQDVISYSLHVRGFTMHSSSKVKHKGTFLGVCEKLAYLKDLGVNQIQCMPVYEFEERTGAYQNYWGYGPGYYFAPKACFSASKNPSYELKEMVKIFHQAGIEVVLEMPFEEGVLPQTAVECLRYYMLEYHIDGFVVNPYNVPWDGLIRDPFLKGVKIMKKDEWYQNVMRRFLKGDEGMMGDVMWAVRHNTNDDDCCNYITSHSGFTLCDLVSYDGKHNEANQENNQDGPNLNYSWNCGAEGSTRKKSVLDLRKRQIRNAFFLLLMSQGTPCLLAGDEFENTQKGNNNVYCQDNELAWLNWNKLYHDSSLFDYVKFIIALRKSHTVLHREKRLQGVDQISCGIPDISFHGENAWQAPEAVSSRQLGILYSGSGQEDNDCFVAYNMHWVKHTFALPALSKKKKWYQVMESASGVSEKNLLLENQRMLEVKERNIVFLIGK